MLPVEPSPQVLYSFVYDSQVPYDLQTQWFNMMTFILLMNLQSEQGLAGTDPLVPFGAS